MKSPTTTCLITLLAAVALAACQQQPASDTSATPAPETSAASTSAPVIAPAAKAGSSALPGDHAVTKHYKIDITMPTLPADEKPLTNALRTTADNAKSQFLQALPDSEQLPEFANRQFELLLDFKVVANTAAFTSVRETGEQDTGGAHPIPVQAAFVFDRKAGKVITLDDLFTNPDAARKALANYAHDTLLKKFMADAPKPGEGSPEALREWKSNMLQMLDEGTKPTSVNYTVFMVPAGSNAKAACPGITLIFPPYQVAPYVYGTQTVDVPASVFAKFLKPAYSGEFGAQ